ARNRYTACGFEPRGRRRNRAIQIEHGLTKRDKPLEIGTRCRAIDKTPGFVCFQIEDVARVVQHARFVKAHSKLQENVAHLAKQARPLVPKIFPIAQASASMLQYPAEEQRT